MTDTNAPRTINHELKAYLDAINRRMTAGYGVSFSAVQSDLPGGYDRVRDAFAAGQSIDAFVQATAQSFGFKEAAPGFGAELAKQHNIYQAALITYSAEHPAWSVGSDGIYAQSLAGVVQFKPDIKDGRWRFALSVAESSSLAGDIGIKPKAESFGLEFITSHADINEAWERLIELKPEFADIGVDRELDQEQTISPRI
ncbi:hypothetical protein ACVIGB_000082 [Bradyrhizobium sp. USDA 4341]